jgi:hypothetical protein
MSGLSTPHSQHAPARGASGADGSAGAAAWIEGVTLDAIPTLHAQVSADDLSERLEEASRRGRLPGLKHGATRDSFRVRLYGGQFDRLLEGEAADRPGGCTLTMRTRLLPGMPLVFAAVCLFTIWPGVWLMDSMLTTYWPASQGWWPTWTWYLPLTILPLPFAVRKVWRSSRGLATEDLRKTLTSIARETDARPAHAR